MPKIVLEEFFRRKHVLGFLSMPHGSSEVVGLIEIDADMPSMPARSLRPARPGRRMRNVRIEPSPDVEVVHADLTQINADLRVELASVIVRMTKARVRK